MYGRSFQDPDHHIWEVIWMDPAAVEAAWPGLTNHGAAVRRLWQAPHGRGAAQPRNGPVTS